jgi:hypothetical protein
MPSPKLRVVSYARDLSLTTDKFAQFRVLLRDARKDGADAVAVASPQVLGDSYDELVANLNNLAAANLLLVIVPPRPGNQN